MNKKKVLNCELLFVIYYFSFILLKPFLILNESKSTLILLGSTIIITVIYIFESGFLLNGSNLIRYGAFLGIFVVIFLLDFLLRSNSSLPTYFRGFLMYGVIPLVLLCNVNDYKKIVKYWCVAAICGGILYCADPILKYQWSGDYMDFGFKIMLPAVVGVMVYRNENANKILFALELVFLAELVLFSNKGAIIAAVVAIIFNYVFIRNSGNFSKLKILLLFIVGLILVGLRDYIIDLIVYILKLLNTNMLSSYSLHTFLDMLQNGSSSSVYSTRLDLWIHAWNMFIKEPIVGYGIGYFDAHEYNYPHNLVLDLLTSSGILVTLFIIIFFLYSFLKIWKMENYYKKIFLLMMLALILIPMSFSLTLWKWMPFWVYFGVLITIDNINYKKEGILYEDSY